MDKINEMIEELGVIFEDDINELLKNDDADEVIDYE